MALKHITTVVCDKCGESIGPLEGGAYKARRIARDAGWKVNIVSDELKTLTLSNATHYFYPIIHGDFCSTCYGVAMAKLERNKANQRVELT